MRDVRVLLIVARVWIFTTIVTLLFTSNNDQVEGKERIYVKSFPNFFNKNFLGFNSTGGFEGTYITGCFVSIWPFDSTLVVGDPVDKTGS